MARGRHARRSGLLVRLARLLRGAAPAPHWREVHARSLVRLCDDVAALQAEVAALREASHRSIAAEVVAELRAQRLEDELAVARAETAALRRELEGLREEVLWAFAERRLPVAGSRVQRLRAARRTG